MLGAVLLMHFHKMDFAFHWGSGKLLHTSLWINVLDFKSKRRGCVGMHFMFQTDVEEVRLEMFTMLLGLFERAALLIIFLFFLSRVPRFRQILQKGEIKVAGVYCGYLVILCFCHFRDIYGH